MATFFNHDGSLSDDGRKVVEFLEANVRRVDGMDADEFNQQTGLFKYAHSRMKTNGMSMEDLVRDQPRTFAVNAWNLFEAVNAQEAQTQQIEATADKTNAIEQALAELREELGKEITALKAKNTRLANKIKAMEADAEQEQAEVEDEEVTDEADVEETEDEEEAE